MDYKEIWFVRHTETVSPESYDFDLSRKGKRDARILGWYMAMHEVATPAVVMHFDCLRGTTMANGLTDYLNMAGPAGEVATATLPRGIPDNPENFITYFMMNIQAMDDLGSDFDGNPPRTAAYIIHRAFEQEFNILRYMLGPATKNLRDKSGVLDPRNVDKAAMDLMPHITRNIAEGELIGMRFPVSTWHEISFGSGEVIAETTPKNVRPAYKAWHRQRRAAQAHKNL